MKIKILAITALVSTSVGFAQKKELKAVEKLVNTNKYAEAKTTLASLDGLLETMDDKMKPQYYFLKAKTLAGDVKSTSLEDLKLALENYGKLKEMGTSKYSSLASQELTGVSGILVNSAIEDQKNESYKLAAQKLYMSYGISKKDTSYLYYAANSSVNAKDYDSALKYFEELRKLNYEGIEKQYIATNPEGKEEVYNNKSQRDLLVKTGGYKNPQDKVSPSKRGEVVRMLGLIYAEQGKDELAIAAINEARKDNPDDVSLMQTEANLYYKLGDVVKYKELMTEIVAKDGTNPDLFFNLGVSTAQLGETEEAIKYYEKAIELKPDYNSAKINLVTVILSKDTELVKQMNDLLSKNDNASNAKYDELKAVRASSYNKAAPFLESVLETSPDDIEVTRTLMQIYSFLDNPKSDALRSKLKALEGQ